MIVLNEDTRVHAFWWVGGEGADWLGVVLKQGDGMWEAIYRFRYHVDNKAFDSDDTRSWYRIAPKGDHPALRAAEAPASLVNSMETVWKMIGERFPNGESKLLLIQGDGIKAAEALALSNFAHFRREEFDA